MTASQQLSLNFDSPAVVVPPVRQESKPRAAPTTRPPPLNAHVVRQVAPTTSKPPAKKPSPRVKRRDVAPGTSRRGIVKGNNRSVATTYDPTVCASWQLLPTEEAAVENITIQMALRGALKAS